ncbi:deaminase domain-containing protein [Paenibacillus terricola]|nr:deaminase domain-containing protein [Paenibacillus terricola]
MTNYFANYANALKSGMVPSQPLFTAPASSSTTSTSKPTASPAPATSSAASKPSTSSTSTTSTNATKPSTTSSSTSTQNTATATTSSSSTTVSQTVYNANQAIVQAKEEYAAAAASGNRDAMKAAQDKAEQARQAGGTISADQTLDQAKSALNQMKVNQPTSASSTSTVYNAQGQQTALTGSGSGGTVISPPTTAAGVVGNIVKQEVLNSALEKAKQDWWDARFANDQAKMDEAAKRGTSLRSQGAQETEAAKKLDQENQAKWDNLQKGSAAPGKTGTAGTTNGAKLSTAEQAKLDQQLLDAKRNWWEARLKDNQALMDKYSKEGADLRAKGALETKDSKQLDEDYGKKLAGKLDNESKLLESKKAWWQAYANMDTNAMNAANKTAEALRAKPYVNDHTDAMVLLDQQNALFIANKKAYYESRIAMDASAMNKALSGMQSAVAKGASLSGNSYKMDAVNNSIIDGVVEWASLTLKRSPEHAADALKAAKALYSQSNFQGALANIDSSKLGQLVQQIQVADVRYWNEVSKSTSTQPSNKAQEEAARNQLYKQLDAVGLKVDYKNSYLNTVNNEIKAAKDLYWKYLDLAKTTADAADPNDYAALASQQQAIYTSIQKKAEGVAGVLGTTAVDALNNNFYTARNQLNDYLKTGKYDNAINALNYLQELKDKGATLNIRRNSNVTQAQADDFLYELKRREWDRMGQLEAPDKNLEKYKVIAKNVLGANGSADKIVNLDKWNEINLKAKADYWRGAGAMNTNLMQTASATLNSADMKKYSTLSLGFDTKLDEINADRIRLAVNDKVYRGNSAAESILETEYDQLDRDIEKAKKAGMGSYVLTTSDLSALDRTMETLYGQKKSLWDIKASGSQPAAQLEASVNTQTANISALYSKLNERKGGDRFTLPAFSMDTANQQVLNLRQQLRTAVYEADADKASSLYDRALGLLDQGATLDIDKLELNFANTDWGQIRIDKMFRDTINHLNSVTSKEDITAMQKDMKKLGFYTGEVTGSYNRDFLTGYGMYQNIVLNNSWYNAFGALNGLQVDGAINDRWLHVANSDVDMGRKVEWAKSEDKTASWGFKSAFTAVGVADGIVSQLMKDGADTLNFIASINVASPKFYTQTIPAIFSIGKAIATGQITWDDIKDTFSESARVQFYTPFKEIAANYNKVFSGTASYAEAQEFGRNVAIALEVVSVVIGIGASAKAAQLTSKLSTAAGSVFKLATGSKAVGEGLEWLTRVTKETAEKIQVSLERKFGMGTGKLTTRVLDETTDALLINRVKNIRSSLPSDLKRSGNVGLAQVEIPGLKKEFYAHSGIDVLSDARSAASAVSDISLKPTNPIFKASTDTTIDGRELLRDIDTEYKILNDVASQLGNKFDQKGKLTLFTEKPPCASCSNVIEEFMARYKNITIEVVHNNHQRILP